jgi:hypothetical protein
MDDRLAQLIASVTRGMDALDAFEPDEQAELFTLYLENVNDLTLILERTARLRKGEREHDQQAVESLIRE